MKWYPPFPAEDTFSSRDKRGGCRRDNQMCGPLCSVGVWDFHQCLKFTSDRQIFSLENASGGMKRLDGYGFWGCECGTACVRFGAVTLLLFFEYHRELLHPVRHQRFCSASATPATRRFLKEKQISFYSKKRQVAGVAPGKRTSRKSCGHDVANGQANHASCPRV